MIISDCDETFNYWEPLNLLSRGFGKQTWEYSPEFAIRSYAYLLPYYLLNIPMAWACDWFNLPSYYQFYFIRIVLVTFTMYTEWKLYKSLTKNYCSTIGNWYLFLTSIAPGMSHAGVALLPSSFGMQCVNLFVSYALYDFSVGSSVKALTWLMIGGIVGWPFIMALGIPYGIYVIMQWKRGPQVVAKVVAYCGLNLMAILIVVITVDSGFYQTLVVIPLNIVLYNVFGGEGEGPEIFGVEPFSYYVLNLLLNFNITAVLALLGMVFTVKNHHNWFVVNATLTLWCLIFGLQPHKEERFLYPVYSLIIVNGAITMDWGMGVVSVVLDRVCGKKRVISTIMTIVKLVVVVSTLTVSLLRIVNLVENYSTPLTVSKYLSQNEECLETKTVCVGREWYHFPTSFFLPQNHRLGFVKSGFDGLLPGDFIENSDIFTATSEIPPGMNNKNQFSEGKVISLHQCDYYIDNSGPTNGIEPLIIQENGSAAPGWSIINCSPIINPAGAHHGIGRLLWIPDQLRNQIPYQVETMEFCLAQRERETERDRDRE